MTQPHWLSVDDVLFAHQRLIARFGGGAGMRDRGLLEAAVERPRQLAAYEPDAPMPRLAAAYTFGVVRNHPFIDGNKRTGFTAGVLFLEMNGRRFFASNKDAEKAVLALAAGETDEADYVEFLERNSEII